jgi:hypothetical protein
MIKSGSIALALLLCASGARAGDCTPFAWGSVTAGELVIEQGAVIVPTDIEGVGKAIPLQLDTGSATTELYGEAVSPAVAAAGTQTRSVAIGGWTGPSKSLAVAVRPASGAPGQTAGTLGTDTLGDGFVLDLEHQRICRRDVLKADSSISWQPLTLANGSPVIAAEEAGGPMKLLLDTGSSGFTLLSTGNLSSTVRTAAPLRQLKVPSFGRTLTVSERRPTAGITVMGQDLVLGTVYGLDDPDIEAMLKSAGLSGLLGMRPFAGGALVFDFPGKRIGFGRLPK